MISTFVLVTVTALIFIGGYEAAQCYSCRAEVRDNATKTGPCWPESFNPISSITAYTVKKYTRGCAAPGNECAAAVESQCARLLRVLRETKSAAQGRSLQRPVTSQQRDSSPSGNVGLRCCLGNYLQSRHELARTLNRA
ncbi:hypothetical protein BV898_10653 [Hypsibius exemplaris]|uniref:Uncharacterized protein n=1 Tax=Hypsibius exemplaris TaxID=2072580 RepID=A0A1W0WIU4_HYPEX|nr:hypothetical protein BV898_10653 [Hypsibius exemplaris]